MVAKKRTAKKEAQGETAESRLDLRSYLTLIAFIVLLLLGLVRLGALGMTIYNVNRLLIGSLAIPGMIAMVLAILYYIFKPDFFKDNGRLFSAFGLLFLSCLLLFHLRFDSLYGTGRTFDLVWSDLTTLDTDHFAGGGLLGMACYQPLKFLISTIGVLILALVLGFSGFLILIPNLRQGLKDYALAVFKSSRARLKAMSLPQGRPKKPKLVEPEQLMAIDQADPLDYQVLSEPEVFVMDEPNAELAGAYSEDEVEIAPQAALQTEPITLLDNPPQLGNYRLPPTKLLAKGTSKRGKINQQGVKQNQQKLEETLHSFGIKARVVNAVVGPSVTKYEVALPQGVKVNRVVNLADDIALALAATDVRIEAPIPGKSLVGVEIPNGTVELVRFRDMWELTKKDPTKLLEVPIGKAVDGSIAQMDLTKMPHLLVAGSTGSGKSVAVNGIITAILMKARPHEVKLLMVDPKMVELSVYNDIPHLLIPVVTNPKKASLALQKVVNEMEQRYELFSRFGVRNIQGYNDKIDKENRVSQAQLQRLPLIVVIVDELADLMMVASKEVEDAIIRLGQKARAAGIHMILATQRPSVDVISGMIKTNVPSRMAFAVSSGVDSRTIIDVNGAEKLLGRGDMLFKPIDANHPIRLQGAFLSDDEVAGVVDFIKQQAEADYDERFEPDEAELEAAGRGGANPDTQQGDPLFEEAKALVISQQRASTSMIQRRLSTGFNRASRLMEELEQAGIVGPGEGTKPRRVLVAPEGEQSLDDHI